MVISGDKQGGLSLWLRDGLTFREVQMEELRLPSVFQDYCDTRGLRWLFAPHLLKKGRVACGGCSGTCDARFEGLTFLCISSPKSYLACVYGANGAAPIKHDEHLHGQAYWRDAQ